LEDNLEGSRIINMHKLKDHILEITSHAALCTEAHMKAISNDNVVVLESEKRNGFYTFIKDVVRHLNWKIVISLVIQIWLISMFVQFGEAL
jgi:hypothetical protein